MRAAADLFSPAPWRGLRIIMQISNSEPGQDSGPLRPGRFMRRECAWRKLGCPAAGVAFGEGQGLFLN